MSLPKEPGREVAEEQAASFEDLLPRLQPRFKAMLGRYRIPAEDAEDLMQEAVLCTLRRWDEVRCMEAWLVGVFDRMCRSYWHRRRRNRVECVEDLELERRAGGSAPPQWNRERALDLGRLLGTLRPRAAAALWLRYGEGMVSREVAAALGYRPESVRTLTSRSIDQLVRARKLRRKR